MYFYALSIWNMDVVDYNIKVEPNFGKKKLSKDIINGNEPEKIDPPTSMDVKSTQLLYYYKLDYPITPTIYEYDNIPDGPKDEPYKDFLRFFLAEYPDASIKVTTRPLTEKQETFEISLRDWYVRSMGRPEWPFRQPLWLYHDTEYRTQMFTIIWSEEIAKKYYIKADN